MGPRSKGRVMFTAWVRVWLAVWLGASVVACGSTGSSTSSLPDGSAPNGDQHGGGDGDGDGDHGGDGAPDPGDGDTAGDSDTTGTGGDDGTGGAGGGTGGRKVDFTSELPGGDTGPCGCGPDQLCARYIAGGMNMEPTPYCVTPPDDCRTWPDAPARCGCFDPCDPAILADVVCEEGGIARPQLGILACSRRGG